MSTRDVPVRKLLVCSLFAWLLVSGSLHAMAAAIRRPLPTVPFAQCLARAMPVVDLTTH